MTSGKILNRTQRVLTVKDKNEKLNYFKTKNFCSSKDTTKRASLGGAVVRNPPANAGDEGSSPGLGRSHVPRRS